MSAQDELWLAIKGTSSSTSEEEVLIKLKALMRRGAIPVLLDHRDDPLEAKAGNPLNFAAMLGKVEWVRPFHTMGVKMLAGNHVGNTQVCQAAFDGNTDYLRELSSAGIDLAGHRSTTNNLSLVVVAMNGRAEENLSTIKFLLGQGCDPNFHSQGKKALCHWACSYPSILRVLRDAGANISAIDEEGKTPAHRAAEKALASTSTNSVKENARAGFAFLAISGVDLDIVASDRRSARTVAMRSPELRDLMRSLEAQAAARVALAEIGLQP